jgi:DNA-binding transcriptional LysR family regulator
MNVGTRTLEVNRDKVTCTGALKCTIGGSVLKQTAMTDLNDKGPQASLPALLAFESVARHLNFGRAASELEITPTAISKTIKNLETRLNVRLFNRTTRSVGLTEHGSQLLSTLAPALDLIKMSVQQIGETAAKPTGVLRINASHVGFASVIQPFQAQFLKHFPEITLEVSMDSRLVDIVAGGFDAGLRMGHAVQRDMVAVPLGAIQRVVVVGSPAYLKERGTPNRPEDLLRHACIRLRFADQGRYLEWRFKSRDKLVAIDVRGPLVHTDMGCVLEAARQGVGLAFVFRQFAEEFLRRGELVPLLERYCAPADTFHLYYPHRARMPGKLRAFIDFIQEKNRERQSQ